MAWKCGCGTQNELYHLFCRNCNERMPQHERNNVYRQELRIQLEECAILVKNSAPAKAIRSALLSAKKDIKGILNGTKKEDLKFLIIPIVAFGFIFINIITQIAGSHIDNVRMQRHQRSVYYAQRREVLHENIRLKIDYAIEESGFFGDITPANQAVKEHIENKKNHVQEKARTVVQFVVENVKRGYEKCRLYFDSFLSL